MQQSPMLFLPEKRSTHAGRGTYLLWRITCPPFKAAAFPFLAATGIERQIDFRVVAVLSEKIPFDNQSGAQFIANVCCCKDEDT